MERDWPFFSALISNAEMACAKADLDIARRYAELYDDEAARERIWTAISDELERTVRELRRVRDEEHPLDREPVLQRTIARRNPFIDPLSFVQLELLRRLRAPRRRAGRPRARAREPADDQRHRRRLAQHRLTPAGRSRPILPPPR